MKVFLNKLFLEIFDLISENYKTFYTQSTLGLVAVELVLFIYLLVELVLYYFFLLLVVLVLLLFIEIEGVKGGWVLEKNYF